MFVPRTLSVNAKGNVAELAVAKEAARLGYTVLMPLVEHGRYDLAIEACGRILRVQCKWAVKRGAVVRVKLEGSRCSPKVGYVRSRYQADEIDAVAAYCEEIDRVYLLPASLVSGKAGVQLRLTPARNNQLAAVNSAADYEFQGAVAQLARAIGWQPVGRGFESLQLHPPPEVARVGAEEFGAHPARFLQRAAAGESFLVTRRGKPMARVVPPVGDALSFPGGRLGSPGAP